MAGLSAEHQSWQPRRMILMDQANNHVTNDHGALVAVTWLHDVLHRGCLFNITNGETLALTDDVFQYLIQTNGTPAHLLFGITGSGEGNLTIYEGTTFSGAGTAVTPINMNRVSSETLGMTVTHTPTLTADGLLLAEHHFGSGRQVGGEVATNEFVLAADEDYLVRITTESGANDIDMEFLLYEQVV